MPTLDAATSALERFECQRCGLCCVQPGFVYLTERETETIARYLRTDPYFFVDRYCDLLDRRHLALKKNDDESCVFLGQNGCGIHPVKPKQCVDFPVKWRTERSFDYCAGLKALAKEIS